MNKKINWKKYRIRELIDGNGKSKFYPQYKGWFLWHDFETNPYAMRLNHFCTWSEAMKRLDESIKAGEVSERIHRVGRCDE